MLISKAYISTPAQYIWWQIVNNPILERVNSSQSSLSISAIASQQTDDPKQYENTESRAAKHTHMQQRYDKKIFNKILT